MSGKLPVVVRGQHFPSLAACANHFKINPSTVGHARNTNRLDYVGTGQNISRPVRMDGVNYPSIQSAARALGMNFSTLQTRLRKERES